MEDVRHQLEQVFSKLLRHVVQALDSFDNSPLEIPVKPLLESLNGIQVVAGVGVSWVRFQERRHTERAMSVSDGAALPSVFPDALDAAPPKEEYTETAETAETKKEEVLPIETARQKRLRELRANVAQE